MAQRHRFEVNGEIHTVLVEEIDGLTEVTIDDNLPILADITLSGIPGMMSIITDNKPTSAYISRDGANFRITTHGQTISVDASMRKQSRRQASGTTDPLGKVMAPLAGVLIDIRVSVGDSVKIGQDLLVVEAMKMQNEIQAAHAGTITTIHFKAGDRVEKGDLLIEYTTEEE